MIKNSVMTALFLFSAYLQGAAIHGRIIDRNTGRALVGANIYLKDTSYGATSDSAGYFFINTENIRPGRYRIIASYIGYFDYIEDIELPREEEILISLKESLLSMDQIVVTGTRGERFLKNSPVTTQVINREMISEKSANNVADVLAEATGITIEQDSRFGSTVSLQGFDSNHILFLVNGVKVIGRLNGQFDISQLNADDVERIEVLKGPISALYGSQAMGGVINIITKTPADKLQLNLSSKYGSYGRLNGDVNVSYPIGSWKSKLNMGYRHFGGCDLDTKTELQDCRAFDRINSDLQLQGSIADHIKLNLSAAYFNEEQNRNLNAIFAEKVDNQRHSMRVEAAVDSLIPFSLKSSLSYEHYSHKYSEVVRSSGFVKSSDPSDDDFFQFLTTADKNWKRHLFQFGYSMEYDAIISSRVLSGKQDSYLHGIFLSDEYHLNEDFTIQGGARLDIHSIYGQQFSPKLSLMYIPGHTGRLRLSYGHGFRAPSFKELYLTLYVSDINLTVSGNPLLTPEKSNSVSFDYEFWNTDNYHVHTNLYYNIVDDLISDIRIPSSDNTLRYTYHNFGEVKTWGIEWEMKYFPIDQLEISLGYTYMDSYVQQTREALSGKSHHTAQGSIFFTFPAAIRANLRLLYFGPKTDSVIDETDGSVTDKINIPDYALLNLNISRALFSHFKISIGGKNLANYTSRIWGPLLGREFYIELKYNL